MASSKQLKICKIDDLSFAIKAIRLGVSYIGVHILNANDIGKHKSIVAYINKSKSRAIIVTKIKNRKNLQKLIDFYSPAGIQLHYRPQIKTLKYLKQKNATIKIFSVITNSIDQETIREIEPPTDVFIYDKSYRGGTGKQNELSVLNKLSKQILNKLFIAGGVNPRAIRNIKDGNFAGFDVQSYLRENNELSISRLVELLNAIKYNK